jgi:DNA replication protein DnaC
MKLQNNPQLQLASDFIRYTDKHLFLTGKAGTGKTTFLHNLKSQTYKRMVVVAPTGVAAINAGGVTIHSFFQLPFGPQIPESMGAPAPSSHEQAKASASRFQRFTREKINIIKSLDLLVIDEISMVRADLLDAIDAVLRRYRTRNIPFGGVQLLMIGDLQQLAPIAKDEEWALLRNHYETVYFFSSKALQKTDYISIELQFIFRQTDETFIRLLNKVRDNKMDAETITLLNQRHIPDFTPDEGEGYITLTTHNYQAQNINNKKLEAIKARAHKFRAEVKGDFPEHAFPTDESLELKKGAQVMFIKNDPSPLKEFYNGKIGKLVHIDEDTLYVKCPGDEDSITVKPLEWQNCRYSLDDKTNEITESIIGSFTQYPLKLAWAVTIHKSQGLTFERAIIDANAAFAHGQVYVALSRCKSYEGMVLSSAITPRSVKTDFTVGQFVEQVSANQPDENKLQAAKAGYQQTLVAELFDFKPLLWRVHTLQKITAENIQSLDGSLTEQFTRLETGLKNDFIVVAEKFMYQVNSLLADQPQVEENQQLQQRIIKACSYFAPRFKTLLFEKEPDLDSDNKAVQKSVRDAYDRFMSDAQVKRQCLEKCCDGFTVLTYLETRAKAAIEKPKPRPKSASNYPTDSTVRYPELLKRIRSWRDNMAHEMDVPYHMVLPRKALSEIADLMPINHKELLNVNGIGRRKIKQFGNDILDLIKEFMQENGVEKEVDKSPLSEIKKEPKIDTKKISLDLFNTTKSIEKVAAERGLATSTIEGHLAHYVAQGELDINSLVTKEKIELITEYFTSVDDEHLGPAREILGDDVSYGELKLVLGHLRFGGKLGSQV